MTSPCPDLIPDALWDAYMETLYVFRDEDSIGILRAGALPVRVVEGDLLHFRERCAEPADAILCMGDTLTHLASHEDVERLLTDVAAALSPSGVFVATFRNYFSSHLIGTSRFLLVRSDEARARRASSRRHTSWGKSSTAGRP